MKLMIVGNTGSGKTTLLQQLMRAKRADVGMQGATVGIDVKDWHIQIRGRGRRDLVLNVWDFAGICLRGPFTGVLFGMDLKAEFLVPTQQGIHGSSGIILKPFPPLPPPPILPLTPECRRHGGKC